MVVRGICWLIKRWWLPDERSTLSSYLKIENGNVARNREGIDLETHHPKERWKGISTNWRTIRLLGKTRSWSSFSSNEVKSFTNRSIECLWRFMICLLVCWMAPYAASKILFNRLRSLEEPFIVECQTSFRKIAFKKNQMPTLRKILNNFKGLFRLRLTLHVLAYLILPVKISNILEFTGICTFY